MRRSKSLLSMVSPFAARRKFGDGRRAVEPDCTRFDMRRVCASGPRGNQARITSRVGVCESCGQRVIRRVSYRISDKPQRRGNNRDVSAERYRDAASVSGTPESYSSSDPRVDAWTPAGDDIAFPHHVFPNCTTVGSRQRDTHSSARCSGQGRREYPFVGSGSAAIARHGVNRCLNTAPAPESGVPPPGALVHGKSLQPLDARKGSRAVQSSRLRFRGETADAKYPWNRNASVGGQQPITVVTAGEN